MEYIYRTFSDIGLKRAGNEDALGVFEVDDGLLAIVCDGLGGNKAGDVASRLTVDLIYKFFQDSSEKDYLEKIKQAIQHANKSVLEKSSSDPDLKGMATTVEVLFLKDSAVFWGHVGDSRIYFLKNKKLKQITKDHSLVQKLIDEGYLTLKEAENHPNKNIIMRALGDNKNIEVDVSKLRIGNDNIRFFLCSDGVTSVINDIKLEKILAGKDLDSVVSKIKDDVEKGGAPDNFSFVLLEKK